MQPNEILGIIVYFIVVAVNFILGRCYQANKENYKRINKTGYQPNKIREPIYEAPKPPNTGSGIK